MQYDIFGMAKFLLYSTSNLHMQFCNRCQVRSAYPAFSRSTLGCTQCLTHFITYAQLKQLLKNFKIKEDQDMLSSLCKQLKQTYLSAKQTLLRYLQQTQEFVRKSLDDIQDFYTEVSVRLTSLRSLVSNSQELQKLVFQVLRGDSVNAKTLQKLYQTCTQVLRRSSINQSQSRYDVCLSKAFRDHSRFKELKSCWDQLIIPEFKEVRSRYWQLDAQKMQISRGYPIAGIQVISSSQQIAISSGDGCIYLFDSSLKLIKTTKAHNSPIRAMQVSRDAIITGGQDYYLKSHSFQLELQSEFGKQNSMHRLLCLLDDLSIPSMATSRGPKDFFRIKIWDLQQCTSIGSLQGHKSTICSLKKVGDGQHLLSCSQDGSIRKWNFIRLDEVGRIEMSVKLIGMLVNPWLQSFIACDEFHVSLASVDMSLVCQVRPCDSFRICSIGQLNSQRFLLGYSDESIYVMDWLSIQVKRKLQIRTTLTHSRLLQKGGSCLVGDRNGYIHVVQLN